MDDVNNPAQERRGFSLNELIEMAIILIIIAAIALALQSRAKRPVTHLRYRGGGLGMAPAHSPKEIRGF